MKFFLKYNSILLILLYTYFLILLHCCLKSRFCVFGLLEHKGQHRCIEKHGPDGNFAHTVISLRLRWRRS